MARRRRKKKSASKEVVTQTQAHFDALLNNAYDFLERNQAGKALTTLERVAPQYHLKGEYLYVRGWANLLQSNYYSAIDDLEDAAKRMKDFPPVHLYLASAYASVGYHRHALTNAELFIKRDQEDEVGQKIAREIVNMARANISAAAADIGVPVEALMQVGLAHERAQLYSQKRDFQAVLRETKKALKRVPQWVPPHNNQSMALFYLGRIEEAIAVAEHVVQSLDAENAFALSSLVIFCASIWQREKAEMYARRLSRVVLASPQGGDHLLRAIEALGLWEDDQTLWKLAGFAQKEPLVGLDAENWYIFGAAAANTGHLKEARKLFQRALDEHYYQKEYAVEGVEAVNLAERKKESAVGPSLSGRFPYFHFTHFWSITLAGDFFETVDEKKKEGQFENYMSGYVKRYPFLSLAFQVMLWNEKEEIFHDLALDALAAFDHPGAYDEIRRFAASQVGSDERRMSAIQTLSQAGQYDSEQVVRFWVVDRQEWTEVQLFEQVMEEETEAPECSDAAWELIEESRQEMRKEGEGDIELAIGYLQKAVEIDPNCAIALHNLGAYYLQSGRGEEGEKLLHRAVEAAPDYLFGYISLANVAVSQGKHEEVGEYLSRIWSAPKISGDIMVNALAVQTRVLLSKDEFDAARKTIDRIKEFAPEHSVLEELEGKLKWDEIDKLWKERLLRDVHRYRLRLLKKPIDANENLAECLNRVSKERLTRTLKAWGLSTKGRKADVIARLVETMCNPDWLGEIVTEDLNQEERDALAWVLAGEGMRPWGEFTARFGDDFDESPYWQWHEPETVPGCLQMYGFLAVGTLDKEQVTVIPNELRPLLKEVVQP
ncbi:MAG: tetratricopeptide repeat protein [Anaerolineales bacterium]|nr:tetratricopeptide repeat protein [Anaerolineales bacterium]